MSPPAMFLRKSALEPIPSGEATNYCIDVSFEVHSAQGLVGNKLEVVGNVDHLGNWRLQDGLLLHAEPSENGTATVWRSGTIPVPISSFPLKYKYIANGHRSSPTTRPLIWDLQARVVEKPPSDRVIRDTFEPTEENSDTGWVTGAGMGALQLRVGQPPGSRELLVQLVPEIDQPFDVMLFEARPHDPNVPQGKAFARLQAHDLGFIEEAKGSRADLRSSGGDTYLMNGQRLDALAFRVDVIGKKKGDLLARAYISAATLEGLEGHIAATLMTPQLTFGGTFRASFLVVTAADYPANHLGNAQRARWIRAAEALDIGHRGSGASKVKDHHVRENTILSFLKAATNHADFIEVDCHVTLDGEVVVHHDFDVKLSIGNEKVKLGIPSLTLQQIQSSEFTSHSGDVTPQQLQDIDRMDAHKEQQRRTFKRHMSSGEDMLRAHLDTLGTSPPSMSSPKASCYTSWNLPDRIATLREALRRTPTWLGFNIELKYPTEAELQAETCRFYSRNYFIDSVLKVVLEEAADRRIIFSTFDPDCATLVRLKQPRYPVFFLTCAGTKVFSDPRMMSVDAAIAFAKYSQLQGVVVEASGMGDRLHEVVKDCHDSGMFIFSWGEANNDWETYNAQRQAGVDGVIMDDVAKHTKASGKQSSYFFRKPLKSPASFGDVEIFSGLSGGMAALAIGSPPGSSASLAQAAA